MSYSPLLRLQTTFPTAFGLSAAASPSPWRAAAVSLLRAIRSLNSVQRAASALSQMSLRRTRFRVRHHPVPPAQASAALAPRHRAAYRGDQRASTVRLRAVTARPPSRSRALSAPPRVPCIADRPRRPPRAAHLAFSPAGSVPRLVRGRAGSGFALLVVRGAQGRLDSRSCASAARPGAPPARALCAFPRSPCARRGDAAHSALDDGSDDGVSSALFCG